MVAEDMRITCVNCLYTPSREQLHNAALSNTTPKSALPQASMCLREFRN